jgi:hypothetical protein
MIFTEDPAFDSRKTIMHKATIPKMTGRAQSNVQQQSGRWTGQDARD